MYFSPNYTENFALDDINWVTLASIDFPVLKQYCTYAIKYPTYNYNSRG